MSSETITRNDLKMILDEVLPNPNITTIIGEALTTTVANTTKTNTNRIILPKGTWLIMFQSAINVGSSKQFQSSIVKNGADVAAEQGGGALTGIVRHNLSWVCTISESTTIYGAMYHNAGSTLTINTNDMIAIQLYSALSTTFNGIADYIVEQGTDGIWTYRKWNSGIAECWGSNDTTQSFSAWGSIYSTDVAHIAFPSGLFIEAPICLAQSRISSGNSVSSINSGLPTKDWTPGVTIIRGTTAGEGTATTFYQAKGRWK